MSLNHSPSIVTDGLVFYYDMNNTRKSWKGAPTFNASLLNGQNDVTPWGGDGSPSVSVIDSSVTFRGRKVARYTTGTSGNCYINGAGDLSTSTTSTNWTLTFYLKRINGTTLSTVGIYLYVTNNTNIVTSVSVTAVEDGWYKAVYTGSGLVVGYPTLCGMYSLGVSTEYYFADWQCENNSFATPWVSGTRSNTQAVLDLTNKNVITATSLTYAAENASSFNGTTNYISVPNPLNQSNLIQRWTVSAWVNVTTKTSQYLLTGLNVGLYLNTTSNTLLYLNSAANDYYMYGSNIGGQGWVHITYRFDNALGLRTIYKNGINISTSGPNLTSTPSGQAATFNIGSGAEGNIDAVSIYDRYLTDAEVIKNFNATRSRYSV